MTRVWAALMLAAAVLAPPAAHAETVRVTADRVDVQRETNPGGGVLGTVTKGTVLQVLGRDGGWVQVALPIGNGAFYAGFVPAVYCQAAPGVAPTMKPLAGPLAATAAPAPAPVPAAPAPTQPVVSSPPPEAVAPPAQAAPARATAPVDEPRSSRSVARVDTTASARATQPAFENRQRREGFWIGLGLGYGSYKGCDDIFGCSDRQGSGSAYVKLGGTLNPQVLLGVESTAWTKDESGARVTAGGVTGTVAFYPVLSSGFFVKGGFGLSYIESKYVEGALSVSASKTGWALIAGLGYDVRVARNVSITPSFSYLYGRPGDIDIPGLGTLPGTHGDLLQLAVGVTFH